ncbi:MAG: hypothetical protein AAGA08_16875 [Pseudomonadota bacterium]
MNVRVIPRLQETSRTVTAYRLLFDLHTRAQRRKLDKFKQAGYDLPADFLDIEDPALVDGNGWNVMQLLVIRDCYKAMEAGRPIDLLSPEMAEFFEAEKQLGVFYPTPVHPDPAAADAEIARIKRNEEPA